VRRLRNRVRLFGRYATRRPGSRSPGPKDRGEFSGGSFEESEVFCRECIGSAGKERKNPYDLVSVPYRGEDKRANTLSSDGGGSSAGIGFSILAEDLLAGAHATRRQAALLEPAPSQRRRHPSAAHAAFDLFRAFCRERKRSC